MSLRIRRGTNAQRTGVTLDLGEIAYTTDTRKLYVGDGITAGGVNILANSAGVGLEWNNTTHTLDFVGSEGSVLQNVVEDTSPQLGGNLDLNGHDVTGAGNISTTGTIIAAMGLGGNLDLNGNSITGTGNLSVTGTISASVGLGGNLSLNDFDVNGPGNININGTINATDGLGGNLNLNSHNITGSGFIDNVGYIHTSNTTSTYALFLAQQDANDANPALLSFKRSRGGVSKASLTNDGVFSILGYGNDGTNYLTSSAIVGRVNGTVSTNIVPGQLEFLTASTAGTLTKRVTIDNAGALTVNSGQFFTNMYSYVANSPLATFHQAHTTADGRSVMLTRARGTQSVPAAVQLNDCLGKLQFAGYNGTQNVVGGSIVSFVEGAVGTQIVSKVAVAVNDGTILTQRFIVHGDGLIEFKSSTTELVAGANPGEVNTAAVATYMKVVINGVNYAIPAYAINP